MSLSTLAPPKGSTSRNKRIGRGPGSGHGKTSTRGHKGYYARSGSKRRFAKEGGQMPLHRRLPKRGFWNPFRVEYQVVNLGDLAATPAQGTVDVAGLRRLRLVRSGSKPVKILGEGALDRALVVQAHAFSQVAVDKITSAGGRAEKVPFGSAAKVAAK